jgi:hypothetical protein
MAKLAVFVARNLADADTLSRETTLSVNGQEPFPGPPARDVLRVLTTLGFSNEEIRRGRSELEERGFTVFESATLLSGDLLLRIFLPPDAT